MAAPTHRDLSSPLSSLPPQRKSTKLVRSLSYISSALSSPWSPKSMSGTHKPIKAKLTPFERFMQLGRKNTDGTITFPPPHWSDPADNIGGSSSATANAPDHGIAATHHDAIDIPVRSGSPETVLIDREDLVPTATATTHEHDAVDTAEDDGADESADPEPAPEPSYIARKIQALLATLPTASQSQPQTPAAEATPATDPEADASHPPRLPLPTWVADSRLVSYLTSPQAMNGSATNGRASVWDLLNRLKSTTGISRPSAPMPADKGKGPQGRSAPDQGRADGDDRASVMLYAPLVPDDTSEVEVARSEVISMFSDQTTIHEHEPEPEGETTIRDRLASLWPSDGVRIGGHRLPAERPRETRIWVPSREKISLEIRWWGYRIYLPPPVLGVLDNKRMENTKRAALLTTALKWLLDHIPAAAVPLQMRPALPLLRRIIPYTGYLGAFVAWSWDAIRSFDKGNGVVLTATWLITFALVPGTWEDGMFPNVAPSASAAAGGDTPTATSRLK